MTKFVVAVSTASVLLACPPTDGHPPLEYAVGADVSFLDDAMASGARFADRRSGLEGLDLLRHNGLNWVRLRLFVEPDELPNDLAYTVRLAARAKRLGFKLLLDFHYSDTWADPGKQHTPAAWDGLPLDRLCEHVREHTRHAVETLSLAGAAPDMVQIGNEVINGILWPQGRLPEHWDAFAQLVKAGVAGVHESNLAVPPLIMMHIDRGADWAATESFFDNCARHDVEFDVIGQSYYPWWHGTLADLRTNLNNTARKYQKDVVLVEVAYYWRQGVYADGEGPFPETPSGQLAFVTAVDEIVHDVVEGRGKGVFWWEPAVEKGPIHGRGLFDTEGFALPALSGLAAPKDR